MSAQTFVNISLKIHSACPVFGLVGSENRNTLSDFVCVQCGYAAINILAVWYISFQPVDRQ